VTITAVDGSAGSGRSGEGSGAGGVWSDVRSVLVCFGALLVLTAACSGASTSAGGGDDGGPPSSSVDGAAGEGATPGDASSPASGGAEPHTPATGCRAGFVTCAATPSSPAVCAHLEDDYAHCGDCATSCSGGSCVGGSCVPASMACPYGAMCGGTCVNDRYRNVDHCGSCFDRCGDAQLCVGGVCATGDGDGTSCASPLRWDVDAEENAGFRAGSPTGATHVFPCGPLAAIPTKWFRFTSQKDDTNVSVDTKNPSNALALAVYSSSACDGTVLVGCSTNDTEPTVDVPNAKGKTFFVAVGYVSVSAPVAATLRVDH
jgi:hypothetical protein